MMNKCRGILVSCFAMVLATFSIQPSLAQLTGRVTVAEKDDSVAEAQGYAGAVVSDGFHVVETDEKGYFTLSGWEKQQFVTIYPSADFSVGERYIAIEEGRDDYSFEVSLKAVKKTVDFIQISDTETFEYGGWVDDLKQYIKVHQPDFVVHTGDICYESGMKWHSENITQKELGVPVYYCLGNHDLIKGERGEAYFESKFGPAWYAFEAGGVVNVITPMMGGDYLPGFDHEDIGGWLENLFKVYGEEKTKFFYNHDLLTSGDTFEFKINENNAIILNDYGLKAWFYGHHHMNMAKEHGEAGVRSYGTSSMPQGGIDHSPSSFREVSVDQDGNIKSNMRWTYLDRAIQINNPSNGTAVINKEGELSFSVNVYDTGADVDSVIYSVWGAEGFNWSNSLDTGVWAKMGQFSDWNWRADVELDTLGKHTLVVDAYLNSGEVLHRKSTFQAVSSNVVEELSGDLEWPNLGGNESHDAVSDQSLALPFQLAWTKNIGSNIFMSSPVLYDDYVLSSSFDDGNATNCFIVCWSGKTGEEKWRFSTRNGIKNQMVVAKGMVIGTDMEGYTYAVDIASGRKVWERDIGYDRKYGFVSGIVTDGEVVYTGFSESLTALQVTDGTPLWKADKNRGGYGTTATMTLAGDVLIVNRQWGGIDAFRKVTGEHLWTRNDDGLRFRDGVLTYKEGSLWVAERSSLTTNKLHEIAPATGKTLTVMETGMTNTGTSAPIVTGNKLVIAGAHPGIAAFDKIQKKQLWEFQVDKAMFYTPSYFENQEQSIESTPVLVGDLLIFGAMDGNVYAVNVHDGKLLWKTRLGAPVMTTAAISSNGFYISDFAGNIYCFRSKESN
ncbi:hypothetical protein DN752_19800 [Echinicola strongylocentroti]|uniref:Uncharacterized protein n=1 Tax=Echinicola strongylocentroti TaxID=1795355 RepID=A0A2Z4IM54_9BACT|nr:PQQ-binding-like beta-propeller repeat protein [Echinicola strongylocentroti]AWW32202.1 hypothetical protein DN752_19800 [Echinicola strongylocentroti]